jgi:hypothetical protein
MTAAAATSAAGITQSGKKKFRHVQEESSSPSSPAPAGRGGSPRLGGVAVGGPGPAAARLAARAGRRPLVRAAAAAVVPVPRRAAAAASPGLPRPGLHRLDLLQHLHHLLHRRPAPGLAGQAVERQLRRLEGLLRVVLALEPGVHEPGQLPPVGQVRLRPVGEAQLPVGTVGIQRALPGQHLQHHHSEAVDVALYVQMACA